MERTVHRRVQPVTYRRTGSRKPAAQSPHKPPQKRRIRLGATEIGVLVAVSIVVLVMIGMPLRNFFQQRSDIARVTASIEAKEAEKQRLIGEKASPPTGNRRTLVQDATAGVVNKAASSEGTACTEVT